MAKLSEMPVPALPLSGLELLPALQGGGVDGNAGVPLLALGQVPCGAVLKLRVPMLADLSATADADPGAGKLRWNHATPGSATVLYVDDVDGDATDISAALAALSAGGFVYVQANATSDRRDAWQKWQVTSITDAAGYTKVGVILQDSAGVFVADETIEVSLQQPQLFNAADVTIADAGAYFAGSTVEEALQELGAGGGGGGLTNWTEGVSTAAPNATVPVVRFTATNAATNVDAALLPKGTGALLADIPDSLAAGGNKRGDSAVDWQTVRSVASQVASGSQSVIGGGSANTASFANATVGGGISNSAAAAYATVPGGNGNTASGQYSTAGGRSNTASGPQSTAFGHSNTVAGTSASAFGHGNTANGTTSLVTGSFGSARGINSSNAHAASTGRQRTEVPLFRNTTDATATVLTSDGGAAASSNQYALSSGMASCLRIMITARQTAGAAGTVGDCKGWIADALLKNIGGTTTLVAAVSPTVVAADAGAAAWSVAITADNALDALKVEVTGEASKTIQWTAVILGVDA